jgi:hypothetical protein
VLALVGCLPGRLRGSFDDANRVWFGGPSLSYLRRGSGFSSFDEGGATLRPAVELPEELLTARLADESAEVRIVAASLMALEGSEDGVAYLQKAVRADTRQDHGRLMVTILTSAWHDDYAPILEEYGKTLDKGGYDASLLMRALGNLKSARAKALTQRLQAYYRKE